MVTVMPVSHTCSTIGVPVLISILGFDTQSPAQHREMSREYEGTILGNNHDVLDFENRSGTHVWVRNDLPGPASVMVNWTFRLDIACFWLD